MGDIGGMLGLSGGAGGTGFAPPTPAGLYNPVTQPELTQSYSDVQNSMQSQQALLAALQAQNGLGNQNQIYNQMQGVVAGTGPNPAQAMLNQSTGQNVANQAALMAGQRGSSANAGLIARQAAQQGAAAQQQAAGQAATLQANQSLNALNVAGNMANTQAANQIGQTNANTQAQQAQQAALLNAQAAYNNAQVGSQASVNQGNTQLANTGIQGQQAMVGSLINNAGAIGGLLAFGGEVEAPKMMAEGGAADFSSTGPQSKFGQFLNNSVSTTGPNVSQMQIDTNNPGADSIKNAKIPKKKPGFDITDNSTVGGNNLAGGPQDSGGSTSYDPSQAFVAEGGLVKAMVSPGEKLLSPKEAKEVEKGKKNPAQVGKIVPGTPKFKGNNYANDVVPAKLKEGGVVIPNSIMQSKDPVRGAADFVRAAMAKKKVKK